MSRIEKDGSGVVNEQRTIKIDRSNPAERWRYRCPRGHTNWESTNNHFWCQGCRRQADAGLDVDPEWYELHDSKRDETIASNSVKVL